MDNEQVKENLLNMSVMSQSSTPGAAFDRIVELERVLHSVAYWFDTDQEVLDRMSDSERADHIRQHKMVLEALF